MNSTRRNRFRGFMVMDVLTGIMLLAVLATVLIVAQAAHSRASTRLAEIRAAQQAAESALLSLQSGVPVPPAPQGVDVKLEDEPNTPAPQGERWIRMLATCGRERIELQGVVPASASGGGR